VAYLSNFENHPRIVGSLAAGRALWGNAPEVLRRVRDPLLLAETLRDRGFAVPAVHMDSLRNVATTARRRWLLKPLASGGGQGVRWSDSASGAGTIPRGCYLQERIEGTPGSVVFVAAGGRAVPLGVSRQLVGEAAFGTAQYRYCGNILSPAGDRQFARDEALVDRACLMADDVAGAFGLVGVNGIDFIARGRVPYPIEVNPRWCSSMELVERAYGLSVFGAHAAACTEGRLPAFDLARARRAPGAVGKAVVFARRDVRIGETAPWLADPTVRDVPHPGDRIRAAHPICTVFAEGRDADACHAALVRRAERVYAEVERSSSAQL
jgi:predicted ATP-grasp superfamily ATP-dependent carboligase